MLMCVERAELACKLSQGVGEKGRCALNFLSLTNVCVFGLIVRDLGTRLLKRHSLKRHPTKTYVDVTDLNQSFRQRGTHSAGYSVLTKKKNSSSNWSNIRIYMN